MTLWFKGWVEVIGATPSPLFYYLLCGFVTFRFCDVGIIVGFVRVLD